LLDFSSAYFARGVPTVGVTCVWAGVDNAWEQEKPEARKMLENAAESHLSGARDVGQIFVRLIFFSFFKQPHQNMLINE
jgi:hypothetical protein